MASISAIRYTKTEKNVRTKGAKMKAGFIEAFSPHGNIKVGNVPVPQLEDGEVRIRVSHAGVNPIDGKMADGTYAHLPHAFPMILGWEAAGVIADSAHSFKKGDEVYVYSLKPVFQWGSWAEYLNVPAKDVALKPKNISMAQAAAIPLAGLTSWQGLLDKGHLKAGQTVLIHAGGGGVGGFAIQWAKLHKAHVITTASAAKTDYVKHFGADKVIDYRALDFAAVIKKSHPEGIDLVLDTIGGMTGKKSFEVLKPGGRFVCLVEQPDADLARKYKVHTEFLFASPSGSQLKEIASLFENGKAKLPKIQELPLEQAPAAIEEIRKGHTTGKIVLKI